MLYSETGEKTQLNGREETAFDFIADDIDAAKDRYSHKCQTNRENRAKGTSTTVDDRALPSTNSDESHKEKEKENIYISSAAGSACAREEPKESGPSMYDESLAACVQCYEGNIGTLPRYVCDAMIAWLQKMPADLICKAITEAAAANKRSWNYAEAILNRFESSNIHSVAAYEAESARNRGAKPSEGKRSPVSESRAKLRQIAGGGV